MRDEAEGRLAHLAVHERDEAAAKAAVAGLREAKHLAAVAKAAPLAATREAAIRALADPKLLAAIVRESRGHAHAPPRPRRGSRTARRCWRSP